MLKKSSVPQIGFVGFGEVNTPREFIDDRCHQAAEELRKRGLAVVETAPVSDDPDGLQAQRAIDELAQAEFDALVLCVAGWIPSWAVMKIVEQFHETRTPPGSRHAVQLEHHLRHHDRLA